jgi:2-dehydropantoate 2-reductase
LELDALVGSVVELGRITGVPTPTISAIHAAVSLLNHTLQRQAGRLRVTPV